MWVLTGLVTLALLGMACAGAGGPPGDVGTTGLQGSPGDVGSTDGENWKKSANWLNEKVPSDLGILSNLGKLKLEANALSGCVRGGNVQHYAHGDGCPYGFISQESMQPITTSSPLPLATPTSGVWRYSALAGYESCVGVAGSLRGYGNSHGVSLGGGRVAGGGSQPPPSEGLCQGHGPAGQDRRTGCPSSCPFRRGRPAGVAPYTRLRVPGTQRVDDTTQSTDDHADHREEPPGAGQQSSTSRHTGTRQLAGEGA